jgi:hypothetical protein
MTQLDKEKFAATNPRTIGLAMGYDLSVLDNAGIVVETGAGVAAGIPGLMAMEAATPRRALPFEQQVRESAARQLAEKLQAKGYDVRVLCEQPQKFNEFENLNDEPALYPRMKQRYQLATLAPPVDAVLIFEYKIQGRLQPMFTKTPLEKLTMENMPQMYAKSKLYLFDGRTGARLFFDEIQIGYPEWSKTTVAQSLDALTKVDPLPESARSMHASGVHAAARD